MRQIWIPRIGGPEVLELREAPDPTPGSGQVRVRVHASGVNFADIMARMGLYQGAPPLPAVIGYEVAGVIDMVGPDVVGLAEGDRVLAVCNFGGYSDVVVTPVHTIFKLPDHVGYDEAAAIPVNYLTAWILLVHQGNVQPGDTVLIHAAAGGVGQAAVQICRWREATIIGTASASKHERLKASGVDHCIDYRTQDFEKEVMALTKGRGVDIILDAIGGESFKKGYRCLAPLGRLFMFGVNTLAPGQKRSVFSALKGLLEMPIFLPTKLMTDSKGVIGFYMGALWGDVPKVRRMMDAVMLKVADGSFKPVVDQVFPFERAGDSHAYIQAHKNFGKVLLRP